MGRSFPDLSMGRVVGTIDGELCRLAGANFDGCCGDGERVESQTTQVQLDVGEENDFDLVKRSVRRNQ